MVEMVVNPKGSQEIRTSLESEEKNWQKIRLLLRKNERIPDLVEDFFQLFCFDHKKFLLSVIRALKKKQLT